MFSIHDNYFDAIRAAEPGKHIIRIDTLYLVQKGSDEDFRLVTASIMTANKVGTTVSRYIRMSDMACATPKARTPKVLHTNV